MSEKLKVNLLDPNKRIITGLIEIDQELAVLEQTYRPSAREKVIKRIDETLAAISNMRDLVQGLNAKAYVTEEKIQNPNI